jgi:hypothetical protein
VCFWTVLWRQENFHNSLVILFVFVLIHLGELFGGNRIWLGWTTELRPVAYCSRFVIKKELVKLSWADGHASVDCFVRGGIMHIISMLHESLQTKGQKWLYWWKVLRSKVVPNFSVAGLSRISFEHRLEQGKGAALIVQIAEM